MTAEDIVEEIRQLLSGKMWNADTLSEVAAILNRNGHAVFDIEDATDE